MVVEEQSRSDGGAIAQQRSDDVVCDDEDVRIAEMRRARVMQREMCRARARRRSQALCRCGVQEAVCADTKGHWWQRQNGH